MHLALRRWATVGIVATALTALLTPPASAAGTFSVLVFSKTAGFRHDSIPDGIAAIRDLGRDNGFTVDATEDATAFTADNLRRYRAVVWLSTTGDVFDSTEQGAFEQYVRGGGGYVGVHAAADTEYDWPWYGGLVGAWFQSHPSIQDATVRVEDRGNASTAHLGRSWDRRDEWYNYRANPRDQVHVLASLDESTYSGGTMNGDHPTAWCHGYDGGRAWYTGGGHTSESYAEPAFRAHLLGGIRYAAGAVQADCRPETGYTPLFDGTSKAGWSQAGPGGFSLDADGSLTSSGGLGLLWYSAKRFGAYSLKLDWKASGESNSGVFVGFPASDDPWSAVNNGYEVQIDPTDTPDRTTGAIYGFRSADIAARDAALNPPGEWNTYEIVVQSPTITVYLNGARINEFTSTDPARDISQGYVGLQNHGDGDVVSYRDVRVKELGGTPSSTIEAEAYSSASGVQPFDKPAASGGRVLGFVQAGDWAVYAGQDLTGVSRVTARVLPGAAGGTIEVRAGSATGALLGSAAVSRTGSWDTFLDVPIDLAASSATGLYLAFTGGSGSFFDVDTLTLTRSTGAETLLSRGRPATASSVENAAYPAGNAVDADPSTRWSSQFSDPQWIEVDLGAEKTVSRVKLSWETAYGSAYTVQTRRSASDAWADAASTTTGDGGTDDVSLGPVTARYVRVLGTTRGTPWGYSLYGFEVYGS